ncbi:CoA transferase subunit A [Aneurinibacillus terranovensis]|uniref:CoA transferase subunit A n=1 Tax=Aneurinibacillus terranovensis TaxID=278991 RepID=UPI001FDF69F9|nr:CoA transferase subunit A [Aneurinibacillus terranovensis]
MYGGFGGVGNPPTLMDGILKKGVRNLRLIGNDTGFPDIGIGRMITAERASSLITSHIGSNPNAGRLMTEGKLHVTFYPQGTLAEKIRAGGMGLGGILVDVGLGTIVEEGKQKIEIEGKTYMVEPALTAEVGIVHALKADEYGNLIFDKSARNFNPLVAMAADITIAEVNEIVPVGELNPEEIITPGIYVDYIVKSEGVNWKWAWE